MNTIEIYLTSVGENQEYSQNFSFAELIKDFPIYQGNYQNIVLNINIPTSILPSGYAIAGVTTNTMGVAVKVNASSLAPNGMVRQSKSFYLRYIKTYTKDNVEYAMFQRPFPQTFSLYAGQGENAPKLTINVVNIMDDTLMEPNPTVVSLITSQTCSLEIMPSTILDKDAELDPTDLEEINARLTSIEEEQLIQNADIDTNEEDIADLDLRVTANEDDIADIKEEIEGLGGTPFTNEALGLIKGSTDTGKISANDDGTGTVNGFSSLASKVGANENDIADIKLEQTTQNNDIGGLTTRMGTAEGDIDAIEGKIPSQASSTNKLADKDFVNSSINALAAFFITRTALGDNFNTYAQLSSATTFYSGGAIRIPTQNDYTYVRYDESKGGIVSGYASFTTTDDYIGLLVIYNNEGIEVTTSNKDNLGITPGTTIAYDNLPTTRYSYQGGVYPNGRWIFEFIVNNSGLTAAQVAAINSGITSNLVAQIGNINNKMDKANPTGTGSFSLNRKENSSIGNNSVALGNNCEASGDYSHAEGNGTTALGENAHTEGRETTATHRSQHVFGEYNVIDTSNNAANTKGNFVEIVGNGTNTNNRSNARTLDWQGNEVLAGTSQATGFKTATGTGNKLFADNGTAIEYQSSQTNGANKIVQRDANGDVLVPDTPTSNNGATPKSYVDNNFVNTNGYGLLADMNTLVRANKTYWYENTTTNQPEGRQDWGTVQYIAGFTVNWVTQLVFPNTQPFFYKRAYGNGVGEAWQKISAMTDLGRLYAGNSSGTYNIENISNFKYILLALKSTADEWITTLFPTSQIIDELNNNIAFQMVTQDNTPNDYKYASALFNSTTNITIGLFNSYYCILWGVK